MRLHLIRHGETDSNVALALDTAYPGAPLNGTGRDQAVALVGAFESLALGAVVTSDLTRAVETGAPLAAAHGLTPEAMPELREIQAGDLEMTTDAESFQRFEAVVVAWHEGDLGLRMPGGETGAETLTRFDRGVARACALASHGSGPGHRLDAGEAAVVAHGAVIRLWTALRTGPDVLPPGMIRNTGVVVLEGDPGAGWRLLDWASALV